MGKREEKDTLNKDMSPDQSGSTPSEAERRTERRPQRTEIELIGFSAPSGHRRTSSGQNRRRGSYARDAQGADAKKSYANGTSAAGTDAKRTDARRSYARKTDAGRPVAKRSTRQGSANRRSRRSARRSGPGGTRLLLRAAAGLALVFLLVVVVRGILIPLLKKAGKDTVPPVITLESDPDYVVWPGQEYEEEGWTATDDRDGDLTDQVKQSVDGDEVRYTVSDKAGNSTVAVRRIPYAEVSANINEGSISAEDLAGMRESFPDGDSAASGSGKTVYLTFDDGPGQYTERLLDILRRNDVHVTFFVTGAFPAYEDMIKKEYEAGHSIGIHTQSHDFDKIYASADAFWKDNNAMQKIIVRQTGHPTDLMRFAGGSSNSMGTWQKPDIMQTLVNQTQKKGFQYFDWNVSSGDGAAEGDSAMVISRITSGISGFDESVVLCHDTKEYTVNAMEYLIPWLLDNGYTIRPLTRDSEPAHHLEPD
ncbi:MAG: DUF5011 domain-containing protein [Sarcina sp.]|nr:DUF5011 domain-containing protein [Sarcina sp.]